MFIKGNQFPLGSGWIRLHRAPKKWAIFRAKNERFSSSVRSHTMPHPLLGRNGGSGLKGAQPLERPLWNLLQKSAKEANWRLTIMELSELTRLVTSFEPTKIQPAPPLISPSPPGSRKEMT
eukprot:s501_g8.t1